MKILPYFLALLALASLSLAAHDAYYQDYERESPLECGSIGVQAQIGAYPIRWTRCCGSSTTNLSFQKRYKVPFIVGAKLSYALSGHLDTFVEFNYARARNKNLTLVTSDTISTCDITTCTTTSSAYSFGRYKEYNGYAGLRYYFDRYCDRVSVFIGEKIGFVKHKRSSVAISASTTCNNGIFICENCDACTPTTTATTSSIGKNTFISGGGLIGLDIAWDCNTSVIFSAEVIATAGPRIVGDFATTGAQIAFPLLVGLKYNF